MKEIFVDIMKNIKEIIINRLDATEVTTVAKKIKPII